MHPETKHEEAILKELSGLPEHMQLKLSRIVQFMKKEMIEEDINETKATEEFLAICGKWKDHRTTDKQLKDIHSFRKSTHRTENMF